MSVGIKIFSPASISNLNCTKDKVAVALNNIGAEVIVSRGTITGINFSILGKYLDSSDKEYILKIAIILSNQFLSEKKLTDQPLNIKIKSNFGTKSGLGLIEAISAAIIWSLIEFHNLQTTKEEVLKFILNQNIAEISPSKLTASIFGGFQLIALENKNLQHYRIPCPTGLYFAILTPIPINNSNTTTYYHKIDSDTLSRTAAFILGMNSTNLDLIKFSLEDHNTLIQIKSLFPYLYNLDNLNVSRETLGIGLTENNLNLFFLTANSLSAENLAISIEKILNHNKIKSIKIISAIDHEGVFMC